MSIHVHKKDTEETSIQVHNKDTEEISIQVHNKIQKKYPFKFTIKIQKQPLEVLYKKGVLKKFAKFAGKRLYRNLLNKIAGLRPATLLRKRLRHRYFPVNFAKFLRTAILQNTSGRLLLKIKEQRTWILFQCLKFYYFEQLFIHWE